MVSECFLFHFFEAMNTLSVEPLQGFSKLVQEGIRGAIFIIFSVNDLCSNLPRHRQIIKSLLKQKNANCSSNNERIECELRFYRFHVQGRN